MCGFFHAQNADGKIEPGEWSHRAPESKVRNEFQDLDFAALDRLPEQIEAKKNRGDFNPEHSETLKTYDIWKSYYGQVLKALDTWWKEDAQEAEDFLRSTSFLRQYNAREVLLHYRNFVGPKLQRALGGRFDAGGVIPPQSDWNGSAKVVWLALEHIKEVLADLKNNGPELNRLAKAWELCNEDLQEQLLTDFPNLMSFERPGFESLGGKRIGMQ
jgi:hypothetical protein